MAVSLQNRWPLWHLPEQTWGLQTRPEVGSTAHEWLLHLNDSAGVSRMPAPLGRLDMSLSKTVPMSKETFHVQRKGCVLNNILKK